MGYPKTFTHDGFAVSRRVCSAILEMRDNKKAIDGGNPTTKYDGLNPADFGVGTNWGITSTVLHQL